MTELDVIAQKIMNALEAKNAAREQALTASRKVIQHSALTIRAAHRAEFDEAARLLAQAREAAQRMREGTQAYPDLYFSGYVQDALKEFSRGAPYLIPMHSRSTMPPTSMGWARRLANCAAMR